jgi:hypothetical protein
MNEGKGDAVWRWVLRVAGVVGFCVLLTIFATGREVSAAWIFLIGSMFGLDGIVGVLGKGK